MTAKLFTALVDELWKRREEFVRNDFEFDYPNYGELPDKIVNKLSSEAIDAIQQTLFYIDPLEEHTKKEFFEELFWAMKDLGEIMRGTF
jgi:hypothetical protein